jgi:uridine kinase
MAAVIDELSARITSRSPRNGQFLLVAIDGRGGSGKTTLARALARRLPGFALIHGDDYWEPSHDSDFGWFNEERFHHDVVEPLGAGRRHLEYRPYDWSSEPHIQHRDLHLTEGVIIERCYAMGLPLDWDYAVWVDVTPELSLARGIGRDPAEAEVWADLWRPREDAYIRSERPHARADTVVDGAAPFG